LITLKSPAEIEKMARAAEIVAAAIAQVAKAVAPGVSTARLDEIAEKEILARGAKPAFKGYRGFPKSLCVSVNREVVHGIPSAGRRLAEGDIVSLDVGSLLDGFYGDGAVTLPVGAVSPEAMRLLKITHEALWAGISKATSSGHLYDISCAIDKVASDSGFSTVREYVGHGIGRAMHEEPQVPNYTVKERGRRLSPGLTLALEPMVNQGGWRTRVLADGWTVETEDGSLSAHFEHTIAVTEGEPRVLTIGLEEVTEQYLGGKTKA
jgi:methionyl aminopeptidase